MLYNGQATNSITPRPRCDMCNMDGKSELAIADASTRSGPWAYLCDSCFHRHANGLGVGVGQILLCGDEKDAGLIRQFSLR
jgi:hypothetical protein